MPTLFPASSPSASIMVRTICWRGRSTWWSSCPPTPPAPCTWATPAAACWATRWPAVLQKSGADVTREFYVNDAGNQIEKFAKSPGGALSPDHPRRGRGGIPGGRLPRRRYPRAGPGVLRAGRR